MPYPGEHAARLIDPDKCDRMRRGKIAPGVDAVYCISGGKAAIQALRFDKDAFTVAEAKAWLKKHDYSPIMFEPAKERLEEDTMSKNTRMLNLSDMGLTMGATDKLVALGDGGLLVKDVTLLANGTWTDSAVRTPLYYPEKTLAEFAGNWIATGVWSRHSGGAPRSIVEVIGNVINPRYDGGVKAVVGDIMYHGRSQQSRDTIEMVKAGVATDVSVEHGGKEIWNPESKRNEAASLAFYGLANVDRGACEVCKIKLNEAGEPEDDGTTTKEGEGTMADEAKNPELDKKLADLESEKAELVKQLAAFEDKSKADDASAKARLDELGSKLSAAEARVKELEKGPTPPLTLPGGASGGVMHELAEPALRVAWKNGEVVRI